LLYYYSHPVYSSYYPLLLLSYSPILCAIYIHIA
jgi:hypothetical protein